MYPVLVTWPKLILFLPVAVTVIVAGPRTGITGHLGHVALHDSLPKYKLAIPKN